MIFVENGALYTCGESESGKLGLPDSLTNITCPEKVSLGLPVKYAYCGGNHTVALTGKTADPLSLNWLKILILF